MSLLLSLAQLVLGDQERLHFQVFLCSFQVTFRNLCPHLESLSEDRWLPACVVCAVNLGVLRTSFRNILHLRGSFPPPLGISTWNPKNSAGNVPQIASVIPSVISLFSLQRRASFKAPCPRAAQPHEQSSRLLPPGLKTKKAAFEKEGKFRLGAMEVFSFLKTALLLMTCRPPRLLLPRGIPRAKFEVGRR